MTAPLLELQDAAVVYTVGRTPFRKRRLQALAPTSLRIAPGESIGIVGESGCGKSSLARVVTALVAPTAGRVLWRGRDLASLDREGRRAFRRSVQIIFQNPLSSLNPRMSVGELVAEPLAVLRPDVRPADRPTRVAAWLDRVGLTAALAGRYPAELSGGQAQRVAIARAMICEPELLVCDEAVSALDVSIRAQVLNLLASLRAELGVALLFISHDLAVIRYVSTRIRVMYLGRLMEEAPADRLFASAQHPYTRALLSAVPIPDPVAERQRQPILLNPELPSPFDPPSGCVFRTRCPIARPNCILQVPNVAPAPDGAAGHVVACHYAGQPVPAGTPLAQPSPEPARRSG
ncbi:MAG: ABC transporter ATP-binding protein [Thermaurantiacus tibetensis]|uniref:ABC transporter ATP-binding protein n=1 Tax=Thermaurantiacus tibetensis TaxID=2759035 RepID=UPI00188E3D03|nr:oligopeptide/dipeptide ABC transporter ATP-binding protein [Thermaurantiacus tibetensis]